MEIHVHVGRFWKAERQHLQGSNLCLSLGFSLSPYLFLPISLENVLTMTRREYT